MMKRTLIAVSVVMLAIGIVNVYAAPLLDCSCITVSGNMDYYSKYMWRGYTLDEDPVIQSGLSVYGYGFTVSFWQNLPASAEKDGLLSNEVDIAASYALTLDPVTITVGHVSYHFQSAPLEKEAYAGIQVNDLPIAIAFNYSNDYDASQGNYFSADLGRGFDIVHDSGVIGTLTAHFGIFNCYKNINNGGDYSFGFNLGMPLTDKLTMTPTIVYAAPTGDLADENIGAQKAGLYGGVSFGYSF